MKMSKMSNSNKIMIAILVLIILVAAYLPLKNFGFFTQCVNGVCTPSVPTPLDGQNPTVDTSPFIRVSWSSNNNPTGTTYSVDRSVGGQSSWSFLKDTTDTSIDDDNSIQGNQLYCYRISAKNSIGEFNPNGANLPFDTTTLGNLKCITSLANIPIMNPIGTGPKVGVQSNDAEGYHDASWNPNNNIVGTNYKLEGRYPSGSNIPILTFDGLTATSIRLKTVEDFDSSCTSPSNKCLQPNQKLSYGVHAFNVNGDDSGISDLVSAYTPVNVPRTITDNPVVDATSTIASGSQVSSTNHYEVSWIPNANPAGTSYAICRARRGADKTQPVLSDSAYHCIRKDAVSNIYVDTGVACNGAISFSNLDKYDALNGCVTITQNDPGSPGNQLSDHFIDTTPDSWAYDYKVVSINKACTEVDPQNPTQPADPTHCFISKASTRGSSGVLTGWLMALTYEQDFRPQVTTTADTNPTSPYVYNTYSTAYVTPNLITKVGGKYGNGALVLDTTKCVTFPCTGIAKFTFAPGERTPKTQALTDSLTYQYKWDQYYIQYKASNLKLDWTMVSPQGTTLRQCTTQNPGSISSSNPDQVNNMPYNPTLPAQQCTQGRSVAVVATLTANSANDDAYIGLFGLSYLDQ